MKTTALWATVLLAMVAAHAVAADEGWLTGDKDNDKWVQEDGGAVLSIDEQASRFPQLTLSMAAIKRGPVTMNIEGDAPYVNVQVGGRRLRMELGSKAGGELVSHVIKMNTGAEPDITLDDKTDERWTKSWKQGVESAKAESVELRFGRASTVKIRLLQKMEAANNDISMTAKPQAAEEQDKTLAADQLLKLADEAVLNLAVHREEGAVPSAATVTVLDINGDGVAVLHDLLGATSVEARRAGLADAIPVQLIAVDAEHDLALVRLDLSSPLARAVVRFIEPAESAAKVGDKVWALGPAPGSSGTAGLGISGDNPVLSGQMNVTGVAEGTGKLDRKMQQVLVHSPTTQWLEVDAVLDAGRSGGPVVDEQGKLVGIGTWIWTSRQKSSPVVSAVQVKQLLVDHAGDAPLGWDGLAKLTPGPVMRFTTFPRLMATAQTATPVDTNDPLRWLDVRRQTRMLEQGALCPVCKGDGLIAQKQQIGVQRGGGLATPIYVDVSSECSRCGGTGLNDVKLLQPLLDRTVAAATSLQPGDENDKQWLTTRDQLVGVLTELGEHHAAELGKMMEASARAMDKGGAAKIGRPVMVIGTPMRSSDMPGVAGTIKGKMPAVRVGDVQADDTLRILVGDPIYVGDGNQRQALVMGVLAGWVQYRPDQPPLMVIDRGWVVPLDQTKIEAAEKAKKDAIAESKRKIADAQRQLQEQQRRQQENNKDNSKSVFE